MEMQRREDGEREREMEDYSGAVDVKHCFGTEDQHTRILCRVGTHALADTIVA